MAKKTTTKTSTKHGKVAKKKSDDDDSDDAEPAKPERSAKLTKGKKTGKADADFVLITDDDD